jgi:hypothetical protein
MLRWAALVGFLGGVGAATAEPVRMSADDIKRVMQPGAVLAIDTPLSTVIPVKVDSSSMVSAEAGALGLTLGALKDRGRWWIEGDQLCMKWFRWFDAKPRCIILHREGDRVRWYENSGESGTATITEAPTVAVAKAQADRLELASVERRPATIASAPRPSVATAPSSSFDSESIERLSRADISPSIERAKPQPMKKVTPKVHAQPAKSRQPAMKPGPNTQQVANASAARKGPRPVATTSSMALASFRVSRVDEGDMLNVRSGPSEYHQAVGSIPARGRGVEIIGECRDLWCPIRHGRLTGWVNRYYLAEDAGRTTSANH